VTDSVNANAARSRSVKNGASAQTATACRRCSVSPCGPGVAGVHVDAVRAAVDLRGADAHELAQQRVDVRGVQLLRGGLVEVRHGAVEAGGVAVEVESDGDRACGHVIHRRSERTRSTVQSRARNWAISGRDLHLDLSGRSGRRVALERALREAVQSGRLAPGTSLPPSRALAGDLGIARNTWRRRTRSSSPRAG
jgi:hypothetical protein